MKNAMLIVGLTIILGGLFTYNKSLVTEKETILKEFNNNHLLDAKGNINLTEIEAQKETLSEEVNALLKEEDMTIETFAEDINKLKKNNSELMSKLTNLNTEVSKLNSSKDSLVSEYIVLNNQYQLVLQAREEEIRRNTIMIIYVPTINQYPNYPTGCESVALTILLNYYGIDVTPDDIIANLKKGTIPYDEKGIRYGGNPDVEFVGSPYLSNSYGVYNNPIADVANVYKSGVIVGSGMDFEEVLALVKNNHPVIVWTSMNLAIPYISDSWIYKNTGEKINWKAGEHAVVIVGYNDENVIISDPLSGSNRYQSRSVFESRYNYYGRLAVYY